MSYTGPLTRARERLRTDRDWRQEARNAIRENTSHLGATRRAQSDVAGHNLPVGTNAGQPNVKCFVCWYASHKSNRAEKFRAFITWVR